MGPLGQCSDLHVRRRQARCRPSLEMALRWRACDWEGIRFRTFNAMKCVMRASVSLRAVLVVAFVTPGCDQQPSRTPSAASTSTAMVSKSDEPAADNSGSETSIRVVVADKFTG